ncbi:phage holin [Enterococcus faecium]|uniref:phage holin n=1 Tax=Enterococcus TaxID=1350 RepID=UPI0017810C9F|nr:phage holin [Enterococcus faecium]MBD9707665.1 phage holin [Enterococcus faecium]
MNKINWKVRIQSKVFVISLLGLIFLLLQQILSIFDIQWDYTVLNEQLTQIINTIFLLLALIGVVKDPTTEGLSDSDQAMTYRKPKKAGEEYER